MTDYESRIAHYFHACGRAGVPMSTAETLIPLAQRIRTASIAGHADGSRADKIDDHNRAKVRALGAEISTSGLPYVVILNAAGVDTYGSEPHGIMVPMKHT